MGERKKVFEKRIKRGTDRPKGAEISGRGMKS